jgi:hypothetical protein
MYENGNMISTETVLRWRDEGEWWWKGEFKYDIFAIL